MKAKRKWLAAGLAVATGIGILAGTSIADSPKSGKDDVSGFWGKLKQWQSEMSEKFRQTYQDVRKDSKAGGPFIGSASMDLREQPDAYTLRLNLPGRSLDKVEFTLKGNKLHILSPAEGKLDGYEQSITLRGAVPDSKLEIERKQDQHLVVVSIPKGTDTTAEEPKGSGVFEPLLPLLDWDRDMFSRMERMQREMDRVFEEGFKPFRLMPDHKNFFDIPRFGSAVDLKEEGDNYIVRAYLPGRDMNNVSVKVEDRTLRIEAKSEKTAKDGKDKEAVVSHKAQYAQLFTLPGPVQVEKMKVDRKEGMLLVTLPKAAAP